MTQRIFDADNPQEIFDLFPDDVVRIEKSGREDEKAIIFFNDDCWDFTRIKINWRDKTEIIRPFDETQWVGCLCWFWNEPNEDNKIIGILGYIDHEALHCYHAGQHDELWYKYCRPVLPNEVKFVEDTEPKE